MGFDQILALFFCVSFFSLVNARPYEYLKEPHFRFLSEISIPPSPSPEAQPPNSAAAAATVFNVLSYGAVGDGVTDDTQAFKMAWDSACHSEEPSIFLVPNRYLFMIKSTIFTGPCRNEIVFKVIILFFKKKKNIIWVISREFINGFEENEFENCFYR